ncbi:MAG: glycosyltransferase family 4 protein [Cyanobacteria bacterium P01_D01_bin.105]
MKVLFLHQNFPAQFRHLAIALGKDPKHQVVFATTRKEGQIQGVHKVIYQPSRTPAAQTHHYVRPLESAVLEGQAAYRTLLQLKNQGFYPDVIYAHSGWGPGLFVKDLFPNADSLCFFEWFYHARGTNADFDPSDPLDEDTEAKLRIRNAPILIDLYSCDRGLTPTQWQQAQFPSEFRSKLSVCHDGIDTGYFKPNPNVKLVLQPPKPIDCPQLLDLSNQTEIITYVARGMEPYRGFPQFMAAVEQLQRRRPNCHVVVVGEDRVAYSKTLPAGQTYREQALKKHPKLDHSRLHFTGHLPYGQYLKVLQASSAHVYLTRPFVLSWSMLEAMSAGCVVIGSSTPPVKELIQDQKNGLLVDFFDIDQIVNRIVEVLNTPDRMQAIRLQARQTIVERYDLANLLPQHLAWMQGLESELGVGAGIQEKQT